MKDYPIRLTLGQTVFIVVCLLVGGFLDFYLGARFGPELFWNIKVDRLGQSSLLPEEIPEHELTALMKDEGIPTISFHEELQKRAPDIIVEHKEMPIEAVIKPEEKPEKPKEEKKQEKPVVVVKKEESKKKETEEDLDREALKRQIENEIIW